MHVASCLQGKDQIQDPMASHTFCLSAILPLEPQSLGAISKCYPKRWMGLYSFPSGLSSWFSLGSHPSPFSVPVVCLVAPALSTDLRSGQWNHHIFVATTIGSWMHTPPVTHWEFWVSHSFPLDLNLRRYKRLIKASCNCKEEPSRVRS